jgi:hypothetical protein
MFNRRRKQKPAKIYTYGNPIDTRRPLTVTHLLSGHWEHVEAAYPELAKLKKNVPWRKPKETFTIHPPEMRDLGFLRVVARLNDQTHHGFPIMGEGASAGQLVAVVQLVNSLDGDHLYIYRLAS